MKKMLILALIALFYIGASVMTPPQMTVVDEDVGYSLTANDQNTAVILMAEEAPIIIDRGVSVPYKEPIKSEAINYNDENDFRCNLYYTIERIDLKLPTLAGFEDQPDKYPSASDLGLRYS